MKKYKPEGSFTVSGPETDKVGLLSAASATAFAQTAALDAAGEDATFYVRDGAGKAVAVVEKHKKIVTTEVR